MHSSIHFCTELFCEELIHSDRTYILGEWNMGTLARTSRLLNPWL